MEKIEAPKKERKFLKGVGRIAGILARELVLGLGRKYIGKVINKVKLPKKREMLSFLFMLLTFTLFAQYPATGNKQRLGYQTTGDGLVWRGRASDTVSLKSSTINNSYVILDTVNNVMYVYIKSKGGWKYNNTDTVIIQGATMPFDSITFNTAKDGMVGVAEVEYNDSQGSLIQGLKGGNVTNVIGQQLHQRVSNKTGSTLSKGTAVYLSGSQGNRITAAKALATSDPTSANTFGIVAESIADNASGYVITEGLITGINTSTLTQDSAVYLSPTVAGGLTSTKPQAPNHGVYIGVCVKSNAGSGELFVKIKNGLELDELHDVLITSPTSNASIYYKSSEGIWRDTTAALLVSDTSSMLTNYLRTGVAASTYLTQSNAASTYQTILTNPITGTGTTNYLPKFTGSTSLGNSAIQDDGTTVSISKSFAGTSTPLRTILSLNQSAESVNGYNMIKGSLGNTFNSGLFYGLNLDFSTTGTSYGFYINNEDYNYLSGRLGIKNSSPSYDLDITGTFNATGNSLIGGTLGVTGATTLSNLAGSGNRMVIAGSGGVLSTQVIPTGTVTGVTASEPLYSTGGTAPNLRVSNAAADSAGVISLGVQVLPGEKSFATHTTFLGRAIFKDYTYTATRLGGLSSTDRFATVTVGTGLSLSSGTLSATNTGTVTSVSGTAPISVANGTTTPSITISDASGSVSGVVNTTTQTFAGNKTFSGNVNISGSSTLDVGSTGTFGGRVKTTFIERTYTTTTSTSLTVGVSTTWLNINQDLQVTLTLPNAATYPGKELHIKQTGTGSVISASSNIIAYVNAFDSSPVTSILNPSTHKSVTLVSDGTYWVIMMRGTN